MASADLERYKINCIGAKVLMMNILRRIEDYGGRWTPSEARLVAYITRSYPQSLLSPAISIAKELGISPSTVVRLFPKLGYASFLDAQIEARREIALKLSSPAQRADIGLLDDSLANTLDASIKTDLSNITSSREELDVAAYTAIVDCLCQKDRGKIYVAGAKNSYAIAAYLHTHLNMCLPDVQLLRFDGALQADQLLWTGPKDILLIVSVRRYARVTLHAARHFRQLGAKILAITDNASAPVAELADHSLQFRIASVSPFDSFTAAVALGNAIVAGVASRRHGDVRRTLRQADDLWRAFEIFV